MTVYFSISDVLDRIGRGADGAARLDVLIPVGISKPHGNERAEDVFQLSSHPNLLDLTAPDATPALSRLVQDVPLYGINLELSMDAILSSHKTDAKMKAAVRKAFGRDPVPSSLHEPRPGTMTPTLRHPILGHMEKERLCEIYITFLNVIAPFHNRDFNFETDILGKHQDRFNERFEGFITPQASKIKASILLAFGIRLDHDPGKPLESYVSAGQKAAHRMRITDPVEMLWAWLEADHHQMRRCYDLDRVLKLAGLPRRPNWVRYDVFSLLEREAIKQYMAEHFVHIDPDMNLLSEAIHIRKAIRANADGKVDETLQQLLSQTLNVEGGYSGAALRFAASAALRHKESAFVPTRPKAG